MSGLRYWTQEYRDCFLIGNFCFAVSASVNPQIILVRALEPEVKFQAPFWLQLQASKIFWLRPHNDLVCWELNSLYILPAPRHELGLWNRKPKFRLRFRLHNQNVLAPAPNIRNSLGSGSTALLAADMIHKAAVWSFP